MCYFIYESYVTSRMFLGYNKEVVTTVKTIKILVKGFKEPLRVVQEGKIFDYYEEEMDLSN